MPYHWYLKVVVKLQEINHIDMYRWSEGTVAIVFLTTALLWMFRSLDGSGTMGWAVLFNNGYVRDGTVATFMAFLLFVIPNKKPCLFDKSENDDSKYMHGGQICSVALT